MKRKFWWLSVLIFVSGMVLLSLSSCEDEDEEELAQGRIFNNTPYNMYNISYGETIINSVTARSTSEYQDLKLESIILSFQVYGADGYLYTIGPEYFEAPEKDKTYTIEFTYYDGFYYDIHED
ncbi:MAG: hypothetical protein PF637_03105 [Spirochaetes bacterium]|nr:hypothetical protein [Spirochaetota bacterium]